MIQHGKEGDPEAAVGPFILWEADEVNRKHGLPSQRDIVREIFRLELAAQIEKRTKILEIVKGRDEGITATVLVAFFWQWLFRRAEVLLTSRLGTEVDQKGNPDALLQKMQLELQWQPAHLYPRARAVLGLIQNLDSRGTIAGQKATEHTGRGNRKRFFLADEGTTLPERIIRGIVRSTATTANLVVLVGQPGRGAVGKAFELFESLPRDQVMSLDWRMRPGRAGRHVEDIFATHDEKGELTFFGSELAENGGSYTMAEAMREHGCRWDVTVEGAVWSWRREKIVYTDDDPAWRALGSDARVRLPLLVSNDFGIRATYGTASLIWLLEVKWAEHDACSGKGCKGCKGGQWPAGLRLWLDQEQIRTRMEAGRVGADLKQALRDQYGRWQAGAGPVFYGADPAGAQEDGAGNSWEKYLRQHLPGFRCLDAAWNTSEARSSGIRDVQFLLDSPGADLRVHERCRIFLASAQQWRWNIPEGSSPDDFETVSPEKSKFSHPADAGIYGVQRAMKYLADLRKSCGGLSETSTKGPGAMKRIEQLRTDFRRAWGRGR